MKIGILTFPFHINYGGIIQAYALQKVLERNGYPAYIIHYINPNPPKLLKLRERYFVYIKRIIKKLFFLKKIYVFEEKRNLLIYKNILNKNNQFVEKYIKTISSDLSEESLTTYFDHIIVGSDQVWRPSYAFIPIENYFLSSLKNSSNVKKIAYGVSFGIDNWEFTEEQTKQCAKLAKLFSLVTVRETSGINLCRNYLGVEAELVLDPTMLLERNDYIKIIENESVLPFKDNLFVYILDDSSEKQKYINNVAVIKNLNPFSLMPKKNTGDFSGVVEWLRAFMDAEYVITDSFHGCVFSIIFNKPFIAICNNNRGGARFESLLNLFNLRDRLIDINHYNLDCLNKNIDWETVNKIWDNMKRKSINLLNQYL